MIDARANAAALRGSVAMNQVRSPRWLSRLALLLVVLLCVAPVLLAFAPWQQTVRGSGRVIAFDPLDRMQEIDAPISGRVERWWVGEGSAVAEGDPLLEIIDVDPQRVERLESQHAALLVKLETDESRVEQYRQSVVNTQSVGDLSIQSAAARLDQARDRVAGAGASADAARAELVAAERQVERKRRLIEGGAVSVRELEVAEADYAVAVAKVAEAEARLDAARADAVSVEREYERARSELLARLNSATAQLDEARGKVAETEQKLAELEGSMARQQSQLIRAPRSGVVQRLIGSQGGEIVSAGDALLVLVPDTSSRAVEVWIDGNDAPLVARGASVRLQFEGWPAVQFAGWPSVAVGTFGGQIALVDPSDDGAGRFRCVVIPERGDAWPSPRYLRQGVRANGWVLLNQVPIGYEVWRQLNGFPPVVAEKEPEGVARKRIK